MINVNGDRQQPYLTPDSIQNRLISSVRTNKVRNQYLKNNLLLPQPFLFVFCAVPLYSCASHACDLYWSASKDLACVNDHHFGSSWCKTIDKDEKTLEV